MKQTPVTLRKPNEADREFYLSCCLSFYHSDAVLFSIPEAHMKKTFDLLLQENPYAEGFILEAGGERAGYALLAKTWSQEAGGLTVWLEEFYVLPEKRGGGIGSAFLSLLEQRFSGTAKRFRLEVEDENEGAVRLYQKFGFEFFPYKQMKKEL
ncbi:MAG: GNAT family N-acetyltransferase [Clostridia bacterium]|nr:GNAT family N-acetyltransferase [Clostridia bacterium]